MSESEPTLPAPELQRRRITMDEYYAHTPEKIELISGYLIDEPDDPAGRLQLLALLLVNVGLLEAVRLAPEARWREALEQVYR